MLFALFVYHPWSYIMNECCLILGLLTSVKEVLRIPPQTYSRVNPTWQSLTERLFSGDLTLNSIGMPSTSFSEEHVQMISNSLGC